MTLAELFDLFVKNWGPHAGGYAILLFVIFVLARKYDPVMRDRVKEAATILEEFPRRRRVIRGE